MLPYRKQNRAAVDAYASDHVYDGRHYGPDNERTMALLALSHTPIEHQLYEAMLADIKSDATRIGVFSIRRLMILTGLRSYSTIRRGRSGLVNKLSIERHKTAESVDGNSTFYVYLPEEIFERRRISGLAPYPQEVNGFEENAVYGLAIERVINQYNLSRREAQVALLCAQGLTNAEIGEKLHVGEQTVKFHLRHVFIKFGVKRRAELIAHLLMQEGAHERER